MFPRSITGIEIFDGLIRLIQWIVRPDFSNEGVLRIIRRDMSEPRKVRNYLLPPSQITPEQTEFIALEGEDL